MILYSLFLFLGITLIAYCGQDKEVTITPAVKGMIYIPTGEFIMGSNDIESLGGFKQEFGINLDQFLVNEKPVRKVNLKGFYIDRYEVTNQEYKLFIDITNHPPPATWVNKMYVTGQDFHPVNNISWFNAAKFCNWADKRLPTEEEWEKSAKGPNGNRYAWGNEYDKNKSNLGKGDTTPVGTMPEDKSYYGVYDMAGNVMEWTSSWYRAYPGSLTKSKEYGKISRVVKGWSWRSLDHYNLPYIFARNSHRHYFKPRQYGKDIGFRCAKDAVSN